MDNPAGGDWSFGKWAISAVGSAVFWLVGGAWWTRGQVARLEEHDRRIASVEGRCEKQRQELVEIVRTELRVATAEHSAKIGERLGEIHATMAGIAAHLEEARSDIVSLFDRRHQQVENAPKRRESDK